MYVQWVTAYFNKLTWQDTWRRNSELLWVDGQGTLERCVLADIRRSATSRMQSIQGDIYSARRT